MAVDTELRMHGTPDVSVVLKHAKICKTGARDGYLFFKKKDVIR